MTSTVTGARRLTWPILALIAGCSILAVYGTYGSIHDMDMGTRVVYAEQSLREYHDALNGTRAFPYQWRLLGVYIVYAGERVTGLDPHAIDVTAKVILLSLSSTMLFLFSRFYTTTIGALLAVSLYSISTVAGFTDGYSIYYTSDYAVIAAWFAAVYFVRTERWVPAILLTLVGALAKETMLLVPVLVGLRWLRGRAGLKEVALAAAAFIVPTAAVRWTYQAPLARWAWWDMAFANIPFLQPSVGAMLVTLKNNVKVLLLFNVLWVLAARALRRGRDRFATDLAITLGVYLVLAYPVVYIRELRHFLPLAILILPLAVSEFDRQAEAPADGA